MVYTACNIPVVCLCRAGLHRTGKEYDQGENQTGRCPEPKILFHVFPFRMRAAFICSP